MTLSETNTSSTAASDAVIIDQVIAGDEIGVACVRRWVRLAAGRYRRLIASDLEDLEQEVLVSLIASLNQGRFRGESKLETYVSRMTHYKCIDRVRAASRRRMVDVDELDLPAADRSALTELQGQEGSQLALRVAASQSQACRDLWAMLHDGLSYAAMADRTGVSAGTLRVRVLRCRRKAIAVRNQLLEEASDQQPQSLVDGQE